MQLGVLDTDDPLALKAVGISKRAQREHYIGSNHRRLGHIGCNIFEGMCCGDN